MTTDLRAIADQIADGNLVQFEARSQLGHWPAVILKMQSSEFAIVRCLNGIRPIVESQGSRVVISDSDGLPGRLELNCRTVQAASSVRDTISAALAAGYDELFRML